jgi:hypothetical protein
MKKFLFFLIFVVVSGLLAAVDVQSFATGEYQKYGSDKMAFFWKVDGDNLEFIVFSEYKGWVSAGFNPSSMMKDADIYIGYVGKGGEVVADDQFGSAATKHESDEKLGGSNDIVSVTGYQNFAGTWIKFVIPLDSGDSKDSKLIPGEEVKVILACGKKDNFTSYHKKKVSFVIKL